MPTIPSTRAAGAVINAVSKQGGNEFTGDILDQFRSQNLVAKIRPVPYDPRGTTNTDKLPHPGLQPAAAQRQRGRGHHQGQALLLRGR